MNYIINPSWFYWISVADTLKWASIVFLITSCVAFIVCLIVSGSFLDYYGKDDKDYLKAKKAMNISAIVLIVSSLFLVFIPSRNTLIEMMIAKQATYDNAQWTLETLKSAVDYIVNAIKSVK